jgi:hypothetical protein
MCCGVYYCCVDIIKYSCCCWPVGSACGPWGRGGEGRGGGGPLVCPCSTPLTTAAAVFHMCANRKRIPTTPKPGLGFSLSLSVGVQMWIESKNWENQLIVSNQCFWSFFFKQKRLSSGSSYVPTRRNYWLSTTRRMNITPVAD